MKDEYDHLRDLAKHLGTTDKYSQSMRSIIESMQSLKDLACLDYAKHFALSEATRSSLAAVAQQMDESRNIAKTLHDMTASAQMEKLYLSEDLCRTLAKTVEEMLPPKHLLDPMRDMLTKQEEQIRDMFPAIAGAHAAALEQLRSQALLTHDIAITNMLEGFNAAGILQGKEAHALRFMESSRAFAAFMDTTAKALLHSTDTFQEAALRTSMTLTEQQFLKISDITRAISITPTHLIEPPPAPRSLTLPFHQQQELVIIAHDTHETNEDILATHSTIAPFHQHATNVAHRLRDCNQQATLTGRQEIFKPTTANMTALVDLPFLYATDKRSLGDVVDCLYIAIFEAAGDKHPRFLSENGGIYTRDQCTFIFKLKHLRNKWLRHDPDHGTPSEISHSHEDLKEALAYFGRPTLPSKEQDFIQLHKHILEEAEAFLDTLFHDLSQ